MNGERTRTLVIGCGNLLRGDDAAGPVLVRRMWERGLPAGVLCADGGTGGMDVAFQMRGVPEVILVDACSSGSEPGAVFEVPGEEVEHLPPLSGINLHAFRWDHAIAFGRWLLKDDYPENVTAFLIEGEKFAMGEALSPAVDRAVDQLATLLLERFAARPAEGAIMSVGCEARCRIEIGADGYLRLDHDVARRFFPDDLLVPLKRDDQMLLLPTRGSAGGGLILKRRNAQGDRSVLIAETFGFMPPAGIYDAAWDDEAGGLRVAMKPCGRVDIPRPQPVGISPFPESHLLSPSHTPSGNGSVGLIDEYNRFVRMPTPLGLATLVTSGDPAIAAAARAAAFAHGLVDDLPDPRPLDGELAALVLMTAAAGLIERGERAEACMRLSAAVEAARDAAPGFAAVLEMQLADVLPADDVAGVIAHLKSGLRLAEHVQEPLVKAELWMKLGIALQQAGAGDRAALLEAVGAYQQALQSGVTEDGQPDWFGQLQNNLGLAYLSIPAREASDQLRGGIAVQSFRHALKIYDRETHPDMWATVSMNLANALQYLPSSHPEENLMRAVDIYEAVLEVRTEPRDPVAHALVLLNQANALAHLGIFKPAIEKAARAYKLFMWHEQHEQAAAAKELHDTLQ